MIKYFDLQRISDSFEPELSETVVRVTRSGWYLQGKRPVLLKRLLPDIAEPDIVLV